jgi:hypothetical protein
VRWQHDHASGKVNLIPSQCADFITALAGEQEKPNNLAKVICATRSPNLSNLALS